MKCSKRKLAFALIVLILLIGGIVWSVFRARLARKQSDFLASVAASGGSVVMDYEDDGRPSPRIPLWLRSLWGDWPYSHVVKVTISNSDQFHVVGEFGQLRELDCSSCGVCDELKYVQRCKHLRVLNLQGCYTPSEPLPRFPELEALDLSGAELAPLTIAGFKQMPQLRTLRLAKTGIGDKGLRQLRFLKNLEVLDLHENQITGSGLTAIQGMKQLRTLDLHGNPIAASYLANLKDLSRLTDLDLSKTYVDNDSMAVLAGLKNLRILEIRGTGVRGPGLRKLYGLKQLSVRMTLESADLEDIDGAIPIIALEIDSGEFTDNGLYHLTLYPMLEELDLGWSSIDDAGMTHLAGLTRLKKLDLSSTRVTDAGLRQLAGLKQLRTINIQDSRISPQGKQKLRAALPEVKFQGEK